MTRPFERPALVVALVNGLVVYLLPLAFAGAVALFASDYSNGGAHVVGVDPDRAYVWSRRLASAGAYLTVLAPLAFAAAWRTFVHAKRWLEYGRWGMTGHRGRRAVRVCRRRDRPAAGHPDQANPGAAVCPCVWRDGVRPWLGRRRDPVGDRDVHLAAVSAPSVIV